MLLDEKKLKKSDWKDRYLKIGDIVKVKEGICPDFENFLVQAKY